MNNFKANMTKLDTSITKVLKDQQNPNYFHISYSCTKNEKRNQIQNKNKILRIST